jgi:molecular chaperone GrpE
MHGESRSSGGPADGEPLSGEGGANRASGVSDAPGQAVGEATGAPSPSGDESDPLGAAQAELGRVKDAWLRTAADYDNFRKRTRREVEDARRSGREDLLKAVLPVFDNLERAIQSSQRVGDVKAVADGLAMVQRQFVEALGREGISRIPTIDRPFDPSVHEAIQQVETADHAPGTVIAEVQPGYTQGDRLVRAAMVVVAKAKSGDGVAGSASGASS